MAVNVVSKSVQKIRIFVYIVTMNLVLTVTIFPMKSSTASSDHAIHN